MRRSDEEEVISPVDGEEESADDAGATVEIDDDDLDEIEDDEDDEDEDNDDDVAIRRAWGAE